MAIIIIQKYNTDPASGISPLPISSDPLDLLMLANPVWNGYLEYWMSSVSAMPSSLPLTQEVVKVDPMFPSMAEANWIVDWLELDSEPLGV